MTEPKTTVWIGGIEYYRPRSYLECGLNNMVPTGNISGVTQEPEEHGDDTIRAG